MSLQTLNDILTSVVERASPQVALYRGPERWLPISSQEFYRKVKGTARALREWGISRGERVAILSENRPEWAIADFAALMNGAAVVPIYSTQTPEQTAYVLQDSGARVIFVSSERQLQKVLSIWTQTSLERIVLMDALQSGDAIAMTTLMERGQDQADAEMEATARTIGPDDLATIIYTSGTTGVPKGAMLTHGNMASNIEYSLRGFDSGPGDVSLSFLPLSHVTARHVDFAMLYHGVTLAYVSDLTRIPQALSEVRPTIFVGVPRFYEKIHAQVDLQAAKAPKNWVYRWALSVGRDHRDEVLAGKTPADTSWKLANLLVFSKVRTGMGGHSRTFISGGAPLGRELAEWYADIGIRIHEGYGLTETSPVIAVNNPKAHKIGTVGKPLSNVEVRIADDGEVLVRGPSVFRGYWNKPDETRAAFEGNWFKTGDIGNLDADGFLSITDRKKDLIKTSGGKFIAPQPIESSLKHNPLVAQAVVLGDKRKFPAVLISPSFGPLEDWARANQVPYASRQQLVADARVRALYEGIVEELNYSLARFERLKKVLLVAEEFTHENGTMTASLKMRRRAVEDRFRTQIDAMYEQAELTAPAAPSE